MPVWVCVSVGVLGSVEGRGERFYLVSSGAMRMAIKCDAHFRFRCCRWHCAYVCVCVCGWLAGWVSVCVCVCLSVQLTKDCACELDMVCRGYIKKTITRTIKLNNCIN